MKYYSSCLGHGTEGPRASLCVLAELEEAVRGARAVIVFYPFISRRGGVSGAREGVITKCVSPTKATLFPPWSGAVLNISARSFFF